MKKILVVDDIEINRTLLSEILRDSYQILDAFDGELFCELIDRIILQSNIKIRSGDIKLGDLIFPYKSSKFFTCQRVALCLCKNVFRYDFQFGNKLGTACAGLKCSRSGRQIVMSDVNNIHIVCNRPVNRLIGSLNDLLIVFSVISIPAALL